MTGLWGWVSKSHFSQLTSYNLTYLSAVISEKPFQVISKTGIFFCIISPAFLVPQAKVKSPPTTIIEHCFSQDELFGFLPSLNIKAYSFTHTQNSRKRTYHGDL